MPNNIAPIRLSENCAWEAAWNQLDRLTPIVADNVQEDEDPDLVLENRVKKICKERLSHLPGKDNFGADDFGFHCLWDHALDNSSFSWTKGKPLNLVTLKAITEAIEADCVYAGAGIEAQSNPQDDREAELYAVTQYLLGRNDLGLNEQGEKITGPDALKTFFDHLAKDTDGTNAAFQKAVRQVLDALAEDMPEAGSAREKLFEMFVGQVVATLPFIYPNEGDPFTIPIKIDGEWRMCKYKIEERIELTPGPFDSLLGFGLTATHDIHDNPVNAPALLTLSGTTWGKGRFISILSDLTPFMSVGHAPYLFGKSKIDAWMSKQPLDNKVQLFGASLGGALCFNVLRNHGEQISKVSVYNPPGLYPWSWNGPSDRAEVNIYLQQNDVVSNAGYFPTGQNVNVYRVAGEKLDGSIEAHGRAYGGGRFVTMIKSSPTYENFRWKRTAWTTLLFVTGLTVGVALWSFYLLACLYHAIKEKTYECIDCCKRKWSYPSNGSEQLSEV